MATAQLPTIHAAICCHGTLEWDRLLSASFIPGESTLMNNEAGELRMIEMADDILLASIIAHPQIIIHNANHIESADKNASNSFIVHIVLDGEGAIEQGKHTLPFKSGDISFRCLWEPSKVIFS